MNGRTEITLLKSTALRGQTLLCPNKWKTRAALAEWEAARSRVSPEWRGAQPGATDAAHRASRLRGEQLKGCETLSVCDLPARIPSEAD